MPIILGEAREIRKLLSDKARRVNLPRIGIAEQERCEGVPACQRIGSSRHAGLRITEAHASPFALSPQAFIVIDLPLPAKLECMGASNPREVVVIGIDSVLRP